MAASPAGETGRWGVHGCLISGEFSSIGVGLEPFDNDEMYITRLFNIWALAGLEYLIEGTSIYQVISQRSELARRYIVSRSQPLT